MKRVVFFIESFAGGGAERVLFTILRHINREKFDVTVLVMSDVGAQREAFHQLDIKIKIVSVLGSKQSILKKIKYKLVYNILPTCLSLKWLLKDLEADTFVAFVEGYCTKVFSRLPSHKNKIAWVHIDLDTYPWTIEKGIFKDFAHEREAYNRFDKVVGVSQSVVDVMRDKYSLSQAMLLYNPVDEARINELAQRECEEEVDSNCFNIASVGRLTWQKGYDELIRLMPDVLAANPNARLYIIGDGEDHSKLEQLIKDLSLEACVFLTGFMENPYSLLKKMDLFVCSSRAEGFSLVLAEAMIIGLPVISMECAGPCELLDYGKYGVLCKSYKEMSATILNLSNDNNALADLRRKSAERGKTFDTIRIVTEIEHLL